MGVGKAFLGAAFVAAVTIASPALAVLTSTYDIDPASPNYDPLHFRLTNGSTGTSPMITASFENGYQKGATDGLFEDTYIFRIGQDGLGSGNLSTSYASSSLAISITEIVINNFSYGAPTAVTNPDGSGGQTFTVSGIPISNFFTNGNIPNTIVVKGQILGDVGSYQGGLTFVANAVPEPATWAMMVIGFGALGASCRYSRRTTKVAFS